MDQKIESTYIPPNSASMINEWDKGADKGEPCHVDALKDVFAWKTGFVNGWYGWANDGKGTFYDFMAVLKAKKDGWKFGLFKQEDMNSHKVGKKISISANDIYNNLIWTLTGKTPLKNFAKQWNQTQLNIDEYQEALEFVEKHFFVIYPRDRRFKNVFEDFRFLYEKFGVKGILGDPFKSFILDDAGRGDYVLNDAFIHAKEFAIETDTSVNFIAHPKSMLDVREKERGGHLGPYKVVTQFMIAGGAAWDNNMDAQYSIYRPNRHQNPNDPMVHFYNLKQRKAEIVGARRGVFENIEFDFLRKQYFFNGVCPMDGFIKPSAMQPVGNSIFSEPEHQKPELVNDTPF